MLIEILIKLIKLLNQVNIQYDFMIKYYFHDVLFHIYHDPQIE
jgi:hypothetical protein